jgi:sugar phosphate isomerase/epimerase
MAPLRLILCAEVIGHLDFAERCAFAKAVGYDGLEFEPRALAPEPDRIPAARRAELRRIAADHGLEIAGFHSILYEPAGLSITSADPAVRARTLAFMEALCELCADLGGTYLVHGSANQRRLTAGSEDADRQRAIEAFAHGARAAAAVGATYLIEPIRPSRSDFIHTVAEAAAIAEASGNPALRTMLDCCSAVEAESEPLPALLDRWLPTGMIAHVHLNDGNERGPGEGPLRFAAIIAALRRNHYAGALSVEPFVFEPDGCAVAARAAGYVRGLLEATEPDAHVAAAAAGA